VRSLEREIAKICRKIVKAIQLKQVTDKVVVTEDNLNDYLGVRKHDYGQAEKENQVGQVVGLAWTEVGGDLLTIEAAVMPGKGNIIRTGQLGDVMKESVEARARSCAAGSSGSASRTRCSRSATSTSTCPTARRPKDGPSAGAAMTTAFVSALTGIPVRAHVAMTGRDHAARRGHGDRRPEGKAARGAPRRHQDGPHPRGERQGPAGHPENVKNQLEIVPVKWIDRVLEIALERVPQALPDEEPAKPGRGGRRPPQRRQRVPPGGDILTH
jgi:ATP-dependent Lon protease